MHVVGKDPKPFLQQQCRIFDQVTFEFTNYTSSIITPKRKTVFHPDPNVNKPFWIFQKMKKEIRESKVEIPEVKKSQVKWFFFDPDIFKGIVPESFQVVDLTAAYATVLHRYKAISDETFENLTKKIPKADRLSSVGMLGTVKTVINYREGEEVSVKMKTGEFANWFLFCCYITGEVMNECRVKAGKDFLFYWVDGIAVKKGAEHILQFVEDMGYPSKIEQVEAAHMKGKVLHYMKDGKKKELPIPKIRKVENQEAAKFLIHKGNGKRIGAKV